MKFSGLVHLVMLWDIKVEHEANYSAACSGDDWLGYSCSSLLCVHRDAFFKHRKLGHL